MKFTIQTHDFAIDLPAMEQALTAADPVALIDFDNANSSLRISSWLDEKALVALINDSGFPMSTSDLIHVPSECCGGCGG